MARRLILGGPGAGKTERLLQITEAALERGVKPERIAFVAFTRAAAREARQRAVSKFSLADDALPWFRTLHSMCFYALGLRRADVFGFEHLRELGELLGEELTAAHPLLTMEGRARTTRTGLAESYHRDDANLDWFEVKRFHETLIAYKRDQGLVDFTDMLERYAADGAPIPVEVAIVDEAQDLTALQWLVVDRAFGSVPELYAAGDDSQAIHEWAGADVDHFLGLDWPQEILPLSHRLPREIFNLSREVENRIERRFEKAMAPSPRAGVVDWVSQPDEADLAAGTWLLLARTHHQLTDLARAARDQGVAYRVGEVSSIDPVRVRTILSYEALRKGDGVSAEDATLVVAAMGLKRAVEPDRTYGAGDLALGPLPIWHDGLTAWDVDDREYYLACRRRGEKLTASPRVRIETIHGAKGAEAENVLLSTDLTYRVARAAERDPDSELRVQYVGLTRASERLLLLAPRTPWSYGL